MEITFNGALQDSNMTSSQSSSIDGVVNTNFKALLPETPGEMLCFDRAEFIRLDFCVDEFVAECRKTVQLDQLRQDLEKYFKRLKGAMIDLINKDYHEFVSLSAHLADLDKQLVSLRTPISNIASDTKESRQCLDVEVSSLIKHLKVRNEESTKARLIQNAIGVIEGLNQSENSFNKFKDEKNESEQQQSLLSHSRSSAADRTSSSLQTSSSAAYKTLETAVDQYNITKHRADLTHMFPTTRNSLDRLSHLETELIRTTEKELLTAINLANRETKTLLADGKSLNSLDPQLIHRIQLLLSSGMLMNAIDKIEKSIQHKLIQPAVKTIIENFKSSGKFLSLKKHELSSFLNSLLGLFKDPCGLLIDISTGRHEKVTGVTGYDFAVRSIWPEIVDQIQSNFPHLFMVTDRNDFHERYSLCREFLKKFELECGSQESVKRLRNSAKTLSFNGSWPLSSYFTNVQKYYTQEFESTLKTNYSYNTVLHSIDKIFNSNVFIEKLSHKFWMLSIKFLMRYIGFIQNLAVISAQTSKSNEQMNTSNSMTESTDEGLGMSSSFTENNNKSSNNNSNSILNQQKQLIHELSILSTSLQPRLVENHYALLFKKIGNGTVSSSICLKSVYTKISSIQEEMFKTLQTSILQSSLSELAKTTKSIPRLYRNTNRDAPVSKTDFMLNCFLPLEEIRKPIDLPHFKEINNNILSEESLFRITKFVAVNTAPKYTDIVKDLLNQVKKIEDSFLKLQERRNKNKTSANNAASANNKTGGANKQSDHDKIRVQLTLDIQYYLDSFEGFGVVFEEDVVGLKGLDDLRRIVEEIRVKLG